MTQTRNTRSLGFSLSESIKQQADSIQKKELVVPMSNRKRTFKCGGEMGKFGMNDGILA